MDQETTRQRHKLTLKQDTFCLSYMETMNASEAYRRAYGAENMAPATVNRKAMELLDNGKITARLQALRQPAIEQAQLALGGHLKTLAELRDKAEADGKFGPAIQAEIARGKAAGLYSDKLELTGKGGGPIQAAPAAPSATIEEIKAALRDYGDLV